ncbi:MAG TPA: GspH/FimT family pseudopilin [Pseudolabrys sp.]|nr:GspH/FimT family pseudopilin [Pseudolabrys sp.]
MSFAKGTDDSAAGYTLLELLAVMAIMALVATIAIPFLRGGTSDSLRLREAIHDVAGALRVTRANAILRDTQSVLVVDVDAHTLSSPALPARHFGHDILARVKVAEPERLSPSRAGIRFYPDGSSTGGEVRLSLRGHESQICVNWLTGEPRIGADC